MPSIHRRVDGFLARPSRPPLPPLPVRVRVRAAAKTALVLEGHSSPPKSSSPGSGAAGGPFTTTAWSRVRSACVWRSIFTRAKASPSKMTTGSDHVALVQRSFPPSIRSALEQGPQRVRLAFDFRGPKPRPPK